MQRDTRFHVAAQICDFPGAVKIENTPCAPQGWCFRKAGRLHLRQGNDWETVNDNDMDKPLEEYGHLEKAKGLMICGDKNTDKS